MDEQPVPRHAEKLKGMYSSMEVGQSVVFVNWKKKAVDLAKGCEAKKKEKKKTSAEFDTDVAVEP